ncbi:MAG: ABC-type transport auxiliary lipoprotein family protein [Pseudomonadota bacterium]
MTRLPLLTLLFLAACSGPEQLVTQPTVSVTERMSTSFESLEVTDVSLPSYAAGDEIPVSEGGVLVVSDLFWADDPTRAVTLALARNLKEITGARVAPEPWPFDGFASGRVDVRVEEFLVVGSALRLSGQYFVADLEERGRNHAHLFDLSVPLADLSASAAAQGRAQLIAELAREIAREAL